jgi:glycosyltransferase involved in cell wall biosynthesis
MATRKDTVPVAVIVPTYNHAHFLSDAIESILEQTQQPLEVVVVDDGSNDRPEKVVANFPSVRIVGQANAGLAAARNRGVRETFAPYLLFLDADDRLMPEAIASGMDSLGTDEAAAFTYGAYQILDSASGEHEKVRFRPVPKLAFANFLKGNQIGMHGTVLYRRHAVERAGGFREHLRACEDYDLYLRLALDHPVLCHDDICAEYRHHESNMSADPAFMLKAALGVLGDYRAEAERRGLEHDYRYGVLTWKRYYAKVWRGTIRRGPLSAIRTGAELLGLAPSTMVSEIAAALRARLERM